MSEFEITQKDDDALKLTEPGTPDPAGVATAQIPANAQATMRLAATERDIPQIIASETNDPVNDDSIERYDCNYRKGDVLAGRYRVLGLLGRGGMGEVYKVEDLEFNETIALKTVLADDKDEESVIARFKREIQLARRVTHRNICRIFDVSYHTSESGKAVAFVTMEYLHGDTLSHYLRGRRLTRNEIMPLLEQMCAGLQAAHELGIVHRDFKSSNVMLVREPSLRVIVTDFGLARMTDSKDDSAMASLTRTGMLLGSPAYMSPEQVSCDEVTTAADIYALGVVLYEMVTGRLPFEGTTPMSIAVKRLTEPPPSPSIHVPNLDPVWERAILKCLALRPQDRFASASEVVEMLRTGSQGMDSTSPTQPIRQDDATVRDTPLRAAATLQTMAQQVKQPRWLLSIAVVLAVIVSGLSLWRSHSREVVVAPPAAAAAPALPPIPARPSIAVLGFKNVNAASDSAWISTALSEVLGTELAAGDKLRLIEGENISHARTDLALLVDEPFAPKALKRIQGNLGADYVISGRYFVPPTQKNGRGRFEARLQNAATGESISYVEEGTADQLLDVASRIGSRLRTKLGIAEMTSGDEGGVRAAVPQNEDAFRAYSEGLELFRMSEFARARDAFKRAITIEPSYALAHDALSQVLTAQGFDADAATEAKKAFDLAAPLQRRVRVGIEARYRETLGLWEKAIENYKLVLDFAPDDVDTGVRLMHAQMVAGKPADALKVLKNLRRLPLPMREDVRLDLAEADSQNALGNHTAALAAAEKAIATGTMNGARTLTARAQFKKAIELASMGKQGEAQAAFSAAQALYNDVHDRRGVAIVKGQSAQVIEDSGDLASARKMYEDALAINREIGDVRGQARDLSDLARVQAKQGDVAAARKSYEEALTSSSQSGDHRAEAEVLLDYGALLKSQGDFGAARKYFDQAVTTAQKSGDRPLLATALGNLAHIYYDVLHDPRAEETFEKALVVARESRDLPIMVAALNDLGSVRLSQGRLKDAVQIYEEVLSDAREIGDATLVATATDNLAVTKLSAGDATAAGKLFSEAVAQFRKIGDKTTLSYALADYAHWQLAAMDFSGAVQTLKESRQLRELAQDPTFVSTDVYTAAVSLEQGDAKSAESLLSPAQFDALTKASLFDDAAVAQALLSRAARERNDYASATAAAKKAVGLAKQANGYEAKQSAAIARAAAAAGAGDSKALADIDDIAGSAAKNGFELLRYEALLAKGEALVRSGNAEGAASLASIEKEASVRGLKLIAERAHKLQQGKV